MASINRTRVYVDGFNLYRGAFKEGPFGQYKWLDLVSYCRSILKTSEIDQVKYFTARVTQSWSLARWERQDRYLRALRSRPEIKIILGRHVVDARSYKVTDKSLHCMDEVEVDKTEEKESDVNLACHMLLDGFKDEYDTAVLVSDDSDFKQAVSIVREKLGKRVVVIRVRADRGSVFKNVADGVYDGNTKKLFRENQLPDPVTLGSGEEIFCPDQWKDA